MKAREVRERLHNKVDPELLIVLEATAELASVQAQEIKMMAEMMNSLTDILMQLGVVTESVTNAVDELKKIREN